MNSFNYEAIRDESLFQLGSIHRYARNSHVPACHSIRFQFIELCKIFNAILVGRIRQQ